MWPLLKAEFCYHYRSFGILLFTFTGLAIGIFRWGWTTAAVDIPGVITIMSTFTAIFWLFWNTRTSADKSLRMQRMLPLKTAQIAGMRIFAVGLFWISLMMVMWIALLTFRTAEVHPGLIWTAISITGGVFFIHSLLLTIQEWMQSDAGRLQRFSATAAFALIMAIGSMLFAIRALMKYVPAIAPEFLLPLRLQFTTAIQQPGGALTLLLCGLFASMAYSFVFQQRRSYLV